MRKVLFICGFKPAVQPAGLPATNAGHAVAAAPGPDGTPGRARGESCVSSPSSPRHSVCWPAPPEACQSPQRPRTAPHGAVASSARVLQLISRQTSLDMVDIGKKGRSPGDQIMESTSEVLNGKVIGHGFLNCVAITVRAHGFHVLCHGAIVFADGQL